jgi:outer membrane murein-binding lipoprotein Lpp
MRKTEVALSVALLLGSLALWGCSSAPTKDELKELQTTRAEISSLAEKSNELKKEESSLKQSIQEKAAKLKNCQDETAAVQLKLKGTN